MVKKFLIALVVTLFVTSSQIAAAADIDWNSAPRISTKAEFARYIESERRNGQTVFHVILTDGLQVDTLEDFANLALVTYVDINGSWQGVGNERVAQITYKIREYPGTRIANAYLSGDTDNLTSDEMQLYDLAVGIVNEANKLSSELEKARYLHDAICKRTTFKADKNTAIAALVFGKADCDGYADAFYMLGRMAGLNVGRVRGYINNGTATHAWNWITFSNGKTYCVDVTSDDKSRSLTWFNAPLAVMQKTHRCQWEIIPNLQ